MRPSRLALQALLVLTSACSDVAPQPVEPRPSAATLTPPAAASVAPSQETGAPCDVAAATNECRQGLTCLPLPGGYCTAWCSYGEACGPEARCVPTVRGGEMCLSRCESDADCRVDQGYACNRSFGACIVPGFAGVAPPRCAAPAPKPTTRFTEARELSAPHDSRYAFEPTGTLLPNGDLVVAYTAMNGIQEPNGLATVVVQADGTVEPARALRGARKRHFDPWLTTFGGEAVLVWLGHDGGRPDKNPAIELSKSKDGASWSAPIDVIAESDCPGHVAGCADKPMVAAVPKRGKEPAALVVFYFSEVTEGLRSRTSLDGTKFGPSASVLGGAYGDVVVDDVGNLHVVAQGFSSGTGRPDLLGDERGRVEWTSSADRGATWSPAKVVSASGHGVPFFFSNAQVLVDDKRKRVHVAYPTGSADGRWDLVLRTSGDGGATWTTTIVQDDPSCANHMKPTAALDPNTGDVHLVWADNRDGAGHMVHALCNGDVGSKAKCGVNEALGAPFARYSFVRHAPSWLGEYDVLLLDPKRRVLHAVWTAPLDEKGEATSRVFYASGKLGG